MVQGPDTASQLSVIMGGNPSGRSQTLMLAAWLRNQIAACTGSSPSDSDMQSTRNMEHTGSTVTAEHDLHQIPVSNAAVQGNAAYGEMPMSHSLQGGTASAATGPSDTVSTAQDDCMHRKAKPAANQQPSLLLPLASKAAAYSLRDMSSNGVQGSAPALHLPASLSQPALASCQGLLSEAHQACELPAWAEGITKDYPEKGTRAVGLLGSAFAVLVHQVAMQCFERGALLAGVWNMFTALMDAEICSLEEHVQVSHAVQCIAWHQQYGSSTFQQISSYLQDLRPRQTESISTYTCYGTVIHPKSATAHVQYSLSAQHICIRGCPQAACYHDVAMTCPAWLVAMQAVRMHHCQCALAMSCQVRS